MSDKPLGNEAPQPADSPSTGTSDRPLTPDDNAPSWLLTVKQLRQIIRSELRNQVPGSEKADDREIAAQREFEAAEARVLRQVANDDQRSKERWQLAEATIDVVGPSPADVQVCFLEGLVGHPEEAKKFLDDPKNYCLEHGVLLDPKLVRDIVASVAFGGDLSRLADRLSPGALRDVASMRERPNACVMEGAATVVATAVGAVLAAKLESASEVLRVKGLGPEGVRLPGGRTLRFPADMRVLMTGAATAVAVYGATTVAVAAEATPRATTREKT